MKQQLLKKLNQLVESGTKKSTLETEIGLPANSLSAVLSGHKEMPDKWVPKIESYFGKAEETPIEEIPKTKMVVVNTPHNPLGLVFGQSDWTALSEILANTEIIVLSDEVYEHMVFDAAQHISVLQVPALADRAVAVSSFGKTFHATGWKLGYITAPEYLTNEIRKVYQFLAFAANTPMQIAAADFLTNHPLYEQSVSVLMQQKRNRFAAALKSSRFRLLPCEGAYFQIVDYSAISDMQDQAFAVHLIETIGVAAIPVSAFYQQPPQTQRWLRFCFAKNDDTLDKSAALLCQL